MASVTNGPYDRSMRGEKVVYNGGRFPGVRNQMGRVEDVTPSGSLIAIDFSGKVITFDASHFSELNFLDRPNNAWGVAANPSAMTFTNIGPGQMLSQEMIDYAQKVLQEQTVTLSGPSRKQQNRWEAKGFKVGDSVVLISGHGKNSEPECNPVWNKQFKHISGKIAGYSGDDILIDWENGSHNAFDIDYLGEDGADDGFRLVLLKDAPEKKVRTVDFKPLDLLILKQEVKEEIISVIKQLEHKDKIFTEWGLGSVIEYGKGMTFLFHGIPGTGKTWAATLIARSIGCEVLTVGPAQIQSSEPGAANRAIQDAFKAAKEADKVLFIDECDSLIFNRDTLGMILSSEVNTLLTEIEKFEGVCILATNRINEMDPALERRLALIVEFVMPTKNERIDIWKKLLPKEMPLHEDVIIDTLADPVMTGGFIKNAVLQAARLAVSEGAPNVKMEHFSRAIKRVKKSNGLMGVNKNPKARMDYGRGADVEKTSSKLTSFLGDDE